MHHAGRFGGVDYECAQQAKPSKEMVMLNAFKPAAALMGALSYPRKFALIGLVLIAPLAFAAHAYLGEKGRRSTSATRSASVLPTSSRPGHCSATWCALVRAP